MQPDLGLKVLVFDAGDLDVLGQGLIRGDRAHGRTPFERLGLEQVAQGIGVKRLAGGGALAGLFGQFGGRGRHQLGRVRRDYLKQL